MSPTSTSTWDPARYGYLDLPLFLGQSETAEKREKEEKSFKKRVTKVCLWLVVQKKDLVAHAVCSCDGRSTPKNSGAHSTKHSTHTSTGAGTHKQAEPSNCSNTASTRTCTAPVSTAGSNDRSNSGHQSSTSQSGELTANAVAATGKLTTEAVNAFAQHAESRRPGEVDPHKLIKSPEVFGPTTYKEERDASSESIEKLDRSFEQRHPREH